MGFGSCVRRVVPRYVSSTGFGVHRVGFDIRKVLRVLGIAHYTDYIFVPDTADTCTVYLDGKRVTQAMSDFMLRNILLLALAVLYGFIRIFSLDKVHNVFAQYVMMLILPIVCIVLTFII